VERTRGIDEPRSVGLIECERWACTIGSNRVPGHDRPGVARARGDIQGLEQKIDGADQGLYQKIDSLDQRSAIDIRERLAALEARRVN
jgi:hypothetical protein